MPIEIVLTPTTWPIDEPLNGFVRGLPPGEWVTIRAQLRDARDAPWTSHVGVVANAEAHRLSVADDVLMMRVRERSLSGLFFQPVSIDPKPAVIVLGGSSGALAWSSQVAALLARRGFAALALGYFGVAERPVALTPLFDAALDGPLPADVFIPVEQTNGPILLVSGDEDRMWPASRMGRQITARGESGGMSATVAFLRESLERSSFAGAVTTAGSPRCR